jgi:hypothetical protein
MVGERDVLEGAAARIQELEAENVSLELMLKRTFDDLQQVNIDAHNTSKRLVGATQRLSKRLK